MSDYYTIATKLLNNIKSKVYRHLKKLFRIFCNNYTTVYRTSHSSIEKYTFKNHTENLNSTHSSIYFFCFRSTRHFGPLAFYLTWHQSMDNLMLELVQTGAIREAVLLMALRHNIHSDLKNGADSTALVKEVGTS